MSCVCWLSSHTHTRAVRTRRRALAVGRFARAPYVSACVRVVHAHICVEQADSQTPNHRDICNYTGLTRIVDQTPSLCDISVVHRSGVVITRADRKLFAIIIGGLVWMHVGNRMRPPIASHRQLPRPRQSHSCRCVCSNNNDMCYVYTRIPPCGARRQRTHARWHRSHVCASVCVCKTSAAAARQRIGRNRARSHKNTHMRSRNAVAAAAAAAAAG